MSRDSLYLFDSKVHLFINLFEYESMDKCSLDYKVRSGHVLCYYDWEQHLRRDDHRRQGRAVIEGIARYGPQGGGQRQAGQGLVN